jgi:hypothetical protein
LEVSLREVNTGAKGLKRMMKETIESEFVVSQKQVYEKQARRDLEISLEVALKSLQNDQVIIVGQELELNDLKNAAHLVMDMMASQV